MTDMSKLKPYDKYQSVIYDYVSQLPEGWKLLPNIAIFQERVEKGFINEELLSVTIGKGVIRQSDVDVKKDSSNEDKSNYKLIKIGDIAYNRMRMWQGALGYSNYQGITSPAYVVLKPKVEINPRFFHYMFRTGFYTNYSRRFSYGIVDDQLSLRYVDFKRMYSVVPPLETQNAIVKYLDRKTKQIQEFISKKERLIELLEEKKKKQISQLLENKNFDTVPLKYLIVKIGSGVTPLGGANTYVNEGIIFLRSQNVHFDGLHLDDVALISEKVYNSMKGSQVQFGDVLLNITGASIGRCCIYNSQEKANVNQHVCILRPCKKIRSTFLAYYLSTNFIQNKILDSQDGASREGLPLKIIKKFPIPNLDLRIQDALVKEIEEVNGEMSILISKAKIEIEKAKEYQESLITQIVTGQLRVPEQKAESTKANWEFKEAVLIAFLTKKCATTEYPLGRKRYTKFSYLFHRYTDNKVEKYRNKAAGPYNPETKYKGPEKIAKQNKYIQESKEGKFNGFVPDENIEKALDYFCKYWTEDDVAWFDKNKFLSNDKLELIATVDKAILDLQKQAKTISFDNVKKYIQESEEWKAKLKREIFSDDNIRQTIKDLDTFFS